MAETGKLIIRESDGKIQYFAASEGIGGKIREFPIPEAAIRFDRQKVAEGDELEFKKAKNGIILECVVPGKEAAPVCEPKSSKKGKLTMRDFDAAFAAERTREAASKAAEDKSGDCPRNGPPALCDAAAPFNFIPFGTVIPAFTDEDRVWSGKIVCELVAKTPFLVCGRQEKSTREKPGLCAFMEVDGKKIIPGTSIKGMLRSLVEILSFSNMLPVSKDPLFWRSFDKEEYKAFFAGKTITGGFLRRYGAEYRLIKVPVTPGDWHDPASPDIVRLETGCGITIKRPNYYDFSKPPQDAEGVSVERKVVNDFWAQLTPDQERRWPKKERDKRLKSYPGLPVFYREVNGQIAALGFCRYFRLKYANTPYQLAYKDDVEIHPDFAEWLFGTAEKKNSRKGRVSVAPAVIEGAPYDPNGMDVVLGGPKPTCLPLYIVQDPNCVRRMKNEQKNTPKNNKDSMMSYNERGADLRGRKLYWHHDVDDGKYAKFAPGREILDKLDEDRNYKVISELHPVAANSRAQVVIYVDHLTDTELGGLLEAIELPKGHAHKLGMGKSLGLGSVRLEIERAEIADMREVHSSLAARLAGAGSSELDAQKRQALREHFRKRVLEAVKARNRAWANITDYNDLPPIRDLRLMMDYDNRPTPEQARTMTLRTIKVDPWTKISYANNAILPGPETVLKKH